MTDDEKLKESCKIILTSFVFASICAYLGFLFGNRCGQQDALEGKWSYQRVVTEDGAVKYIQLDKPVIRKAETKP